MKIPHFYLLFEPRDLWIRAFVDTVKSRLYLLPIPCCRLVIDWSVEKTERAKQEEETVNRNGHFSLPESS